MHVETMLELTDLPRECIEDCSGSGDATEAVYHWVDTLGLTVDGNRAVKCLLGYGAWEAEELLDMDNRELAAKVLFLACGDFSEYLTAVEDGEYTIGDFGEYQTNCGSDIFVLE